MIKKGDTVIIKAEFMSQAEIDMGVFFTATDDEEKGRVTVQADCEGCTLPLKPTSVINVSWVEK